ncbi:hypothetical protein [Paracoccus jiaweipingae]|uniref:hypothetical protein n=1 Tax=unclassified Paracoccus (in: a-proteobacteria) TaxID=2688777 RepID=UPI00379E7B54
MFSPFATRLTLTAAAAMLALMPTAGLAKLESRADTQREPRAWTAIAGADTASVMEAARSQTANGAETPYCDATGTVQTTLDHDFGEAFVSKGRDGTELWGSNLMGTWTLVMDRGDQTSCVVASGVGFNEKTSPQRYFALAGLVD